MPERASSDIDRVWLPRYEIEWENEACRFVSSLVSQDPAPWVAHDFVHARTIAFHFIAPATRLTTLKAVLATYGRRNSAPFWCELRDEMDKVVCSRFILAEDVADNALVTLLDLSGVDLVASIAYKVLLSSPLALPNDHLTIWLQHAARSHYDVVRQLIAFKQDRTFIYKKEDVSDIYPRRAVLVSGAKGETLTKLASRLSAAFTGTSFDVITPQTPASLWPCCDNAHLVAFDGPLPGDNEGAIGFDALCFTFNRMGIATIWIDETYEVEVASVRFTSTMQRQSEQNQLHLTSRRCRFVLQEDGQLQDPGSLNVVEPIKTNANSSLEFLVAKLKAERYSRVCVVSVLYRKADVVGAFIESIVDQNYPGEIEIVLVDDTSPQNDAIVASNWRDLLKDGGITNRSVRILSNDQNLGNCASRNKGIAASDADIYIVIDCDCLLNREFVAAHVFEHARAGVDVVIGPLNIETNGRDPTDVLRELESYPSRALSEAKPQDGIQLNGFLNCITRNFSIKRAAAKLEPLFDIDFSYSANPDTGFGWEDVEMGWRLYARGAVIHFSERAFSVHISHAASAPDRVKVLGSMRNFEKLFVKHPDIALVARRWALDTYDKLVGWAAEQDVVHSEAAQALARRFEPAWMNFKSLVRSYRPHQRRLQILSYRWHVPHQYELHKLPHDFTLVTGTGRNGAMDNWSFDQRPLRPNVRFLDAQQVREEDYDLAILHFDENVLNPQLCNGVIPSCWGDQFLWLLGCKTLPKVAICHGTPQFVGQYAANPNPIGKFEIHEQARALLVDTLNRNGVEIVCNSHQAAAEWRFAQSRVIWHGFDPQEFPAGQHDLDILALAPDRHRPHYRGASHYETIKARLDPGLEIGTAKHLGAIFEPRASHAFAVANFRSYVNRIGRFKAYLNTTLRSPMPRSRGEAMMTGVFPVCLNNHDVDQFIDSGVNGFYSNDAEELADFLNHTLRNPEATKRISIAARRTALDLFNHDRYLSSWTNLLAEMII